MNEGKLDVNDPVEAKPESEIELNISEESIATDELVANKEVDQVMGAFFLIRSNLYKECLGFDERFFVYYEEVDLSKRVNSLGFKSMFFAESNAYHIGGGVSQQVKAKRLFYSLRSKS